MDMLIQSEQALSFNYLDFNTDKWSRYSFLVINGGQYIISIQMY